MYPIERPAIADVLLLGAVSRRGVAKDERAQAILVDGHALDAVGRLGALDERHLAERLEYLGRLVLIELLPAFGLGEGLEHPDGGLREQQLLEPRAPE